MFVRRPDCVEGGLTNDERVRLRAHTQSWIATAFRTEPADPIKITKAIQDLYASAGLKKPVVVLVPSPLVMAFAYGAASAILQRGSNLDATDRATLEAIDRVTHEATYAATHGSTDTATYAATYEATFAVTHRAHEATDMAAFWAAHRATHEATYRATYGATDMATREATYGATHEATYRATHMAICDATHEVAYRAYHKATTCEAARQACFDLAGQLGLDNAGHSTAIRQGGAMYIAYDCYLTAMRDVLGLRLPCHAAYSAWERCAREGSYRVIHPEFCLVSDFPELLLMDDRNRPHCETGPSHRWRDGWSLYHWHGVRVPAAWIEDRGSLVPATIFAEENAELRRAGCEIIGYDKVLSGINAFLIDEDGDPQIGTLYRGRIPGASSCGFLRVICGTGRIFVIPVPVHLQTALAAQAWIQNISIQDWVKPEVRG